MLRSGRLCWGVLAALGGCLGGVAHAATISLLPVTNSVAPGSLFTLDVRIAGLDDAVALGGFDLDVNFDSALISFQDAKFGDPLLGDQLDLSQLGLNGPAVTPGAGTVNLLEVSLDDPDLLESSQAPAFTLATLSFLATAAGSSPLTLSINSLTDQIGATLDASVTGASVAIAPVPLPAAWILLSSGAFVLGAINRRRRSASLAVV